MLLDLFRRMPGKRTRDIRACLRAFSLALRLFDRYVTLPSASNQVHQPHPVRGADDLRLCVYSRLVTLLDVKADVVRELVEEATRRGVKVRHLLLDRAFFTTECIDLLDGKGVDFIIPCALGERVRLGRDGGR